MAPTSSDPAVALNADDAWAILRGLRRLARAGLDLPVGLAWAASGAADLELRRAADPAARLVVMGPERWQARPAPSEEARALIDLYLPIALASAARPLAVAHLGQSLDGCIATAAGASHYVTGEANLVHMHRMRALADAVLVGAATVALDDPQLTVRRVPGDSPVRVVIDPARRLPVERRVFRDGAAPTLLLCAESCVEPGGAWHGEAEVVGVPASPDGLAPADILRAVHERGLHGVFVEGGGVTVSRWFAAGALDRLQVAVAPLLIGGGRRGLVAPPIRELNEAERLRCRPVVMGQDVLFDCPLR